MANLAYQVTGFAYQGVGQFAYQGSVDAQPGTPRDPGSGSGGRKRKRIPFAHLFEIEPAEAESNPPLPEAVAQTAASRPGTTEPTPGREPATVPASLVERAAEIKQEMLALERGYAARISDTEIAELEQRRAALERALIELYDREAVLMLTLMDD